MKHLKNFNEEIENSHKDVRSHDFYVEYKSLFNNEDNEFGDSNSDLLDEIGDLCNEHEIKRDDIKWILDNYDCSFDVDKLLKIVYDEWVDEENNLEAIENKIIECLNEADSNLDYDDFSRLAESIISYIDRIKFR